MPRPEGAAGSRAVTVTSQLPEVDGATTSVSVPWRSNGESTAIRRPSGPRAASSTSTPRCSTATRKTRPPASSAR